jgi:hypothetical protein
MKKSLALLFFALLCVSTSYAQTTQNFVVNFGVQHPTNQLATEIYKPGFAAGLRMGYGGKYVGIFIPIGYEQWKMKPGARSSNPMMDSMISSRGDDPTVNVYTGFGIEATWPKDFFVSLTTAAEGNIGMYVGKSHFLMVQQRDAEGTMEAHLSLAYSLSGRLNFRLFYDRENDAAMFLFLKYEYRVLPAAIQKNIFNSYHFGFAINIYYPE